MNVDYTKSQTPCKYICGTCGASGCKLWRPYGSPAIALRCVDCTAKEEKRDVSTLDAQGRHLGRAGWTNQIGRYVPAVPIKDDARVFWSYNIVPRGACAWWDSLPNRAKP